MANLFGCSGGNSSQSETPLASPCVPPSASGSHPTNNLTSPRGGHTATLLPDGTVLVAGGYGTAGGLASAELYDPGANTWTAITSPMTSVRSRHTATLLPNGKVLVAGGYGTAGALASAELYDPATAQWTATGSLSETRIDYTATLLPNGKVLVAGGFGSVGALAFTETVIPSSEIQATLIWNPVSDPSVQEYKVYYGTAPKTYQQVIDVGLSMTYVFSNLQRGTTYYFSVTAYNRAGESCASNEVSKTVP